MHASTACTDTMLSEGHELDAATIETCIDALQAVQVAKLRSPCLRLASCRRTPSSCACDQQLTASCSLRQLDAHQPECSCSEQAVAVTAACCTSVAYVCDAVCRSVTDWRVQRAPHCSACRPGCSSIRRAGRNSALHRAARRAAWRTMRGAACCRAGGSASRGALARRSCSCRGPPAQTAGSAECDATHTTRCTSAVIC